MRQQTVLAVSLAVAFHVFAVNGQVIEPAAGPAFTGETRTSKALRIAELRDDPPVAVLEESEVVEPELISSLAEWNGGGGQPRRNGFARRLPARIEIRLDRQNTRILSSPTATADTERASSWSGSIRVKGAFRLRLHLERANIPADATLWVWGEGEAPQPFGRELVDEVSGLWTPSVQGERAFLEVELPRERSGDGLSFEITEVLEIIGSNRPPQPDATPCLVDEACRGAQNAERSVAHLQFVVGSYGYVCTGGLLNDDVATSAIPYLLTANHCFSTSASANSLEAFWDYKRSTCDGAWPSLAGLKKSNGSTLLASSAGTDFTLVRLNSIPSNRWLMGWDPRTLSAGTVLHRLSHPVPDGSNQAWPQVYSKTTLTTTAGTCSSLPRPEFLYSQPVEGGIAGGSSGSLVYLDGDYVVGQLFGVCGPSPDEDCVAANNIVDGAFASTYVSISQFLRPTGTSSCIANSTTACMLNKRFKVQIIYRNHFVNPPQDSYALVKSVTGFSNAKYETSFFYFNNPDSIEILTKLIDQGRPDGRIDFLYGSSNPFELFITVTDTKSGLVKNYYTPINAQSGATDFGAFPP